MTYIKGHKDDEGKTYFEKLHTYIDFPKESKTPERTSYLVKSSAKHKGLIKQGYSVHEYGKHDEKTTHYTMPVKIRKLDEAEDFLTKFDPREKAAYPSDKQIPNVLLLKRKAIRVFPDHQKVALYYAQAIDKYLTVPFGISGETGIPTMFREDSINEVSKRFLQAYARKASKDKKKDRSKGVKLAKDRLDRGEFSEEVSAQYKKHSPSASSSASSNVSSNMVGAGVYKKNHKPVVTQKPTETVPTVKKKKESHDYFAGGGFYGIGHAIGLSIGKPIGWGIGKIKDKFAAKSPVPDGTTPPETGEPVAATGTAPKSFSRTGYKQKPALRTIPKPITTKHNPSPPASAPLPAGKEKAEAPPEPEKKVVTKFVKKKPVAGTGEQPDTSNLSFPGHDKPSVSLARKRYNFDPKAPGTGEQPKVKNVIKRKKKLVAEADDEDEQQAVQSAAEAAAKRQKRSFGTNRKENITNRSDEDKEKTQANIAKAGEIASYAAGGVGIARGIAVKAGTAIAAKTAAKSAAKAAPSTAAKTAVKTGETAAVKTGEAAAETGAKTAPKSFSRTGYRQKPAAPGAASKAKGRWGGWGRKAAGAIGSAAAGAAGGIATGAGGDSKTGAVQPHEYSFTAKPTTSRATPVTTQGNFASPAQNLLYQKAFLKEKKSTK
jgi:hypothetical protein